MRPLSAEVDKDEASLIIHRVAPNTGTFMMVTTADDLPLTLL